ncbi:hypothetical protein F53441_3415 [Fusarium austroafricanum]|uniref:Amino acid permease/ SLC12A domain-containing protein n=1 Tax=Fusarium austroafricanum TaxID=2364996 RepID=A0A8H4KQ82_9HYPO|nr:hypothetical protein F53441_3415 [Fusarium austroafricanum]
MNDFAAYQDHHHEPRRSEEPGYDSDQNGIITTTVDNPNEIYTSAPKEAFKLGYFDVMCLVLNRMIGTGIFNSPQRVMEGTHSTGASLLLWLAGIIYCLSGVHVYIEYGLNVPRYTIDGIEQSVPRSGGDLNYLQYVYRKPAGSVLLSTCMFGLCFVALGNMAGNCISFATRVLFASGNMDPAPSAIRGIAIGIAILTCFIHTFSRRGGILLNNLLAMIKVMILLLIIVTAIVVGAGGLKTDENGKEVPVKNYISENTQPSRAFANSNDANGYAHAFLAIIFSLSGFEQPNYVMGEISKPRRKYPIAMMLGVGIVTLLYMAVNISYMVVVSKEDQIKENVAQVFFQNTFGSLTESQTGQRIFNAFLAVSSLGNIIVMTYTASRVKQEIAKEGILPYAKFFAQDGDMSLGRVLAWLKKKGMFSSLLSTRWLSPEDHKERTPIGAFVLHLASCFILIFATWGVNYDDAYTLLTSLTAYVINAFFGIFLGLGILILRFKGPPKTDKDEVQSPATAPPQTWRQMTGKHINPTLSVICATIYIIGGLWPIATIWIKPTTQQALRWWLVPTISWCVIGGSALWYLGFISLAWRRKQKRNEIFVVEKKPEFESAEGSEDAGGKAGGYVLVHETVYLSWIASEVHESREPGLTGFEERGDKMAVSSASPYAGTDFEAHYQNDHGAVPAGGYGMAYRP